MTNKPVRGVTLFYSYSHRDEELRNELEKHLAILKRSGIITDWHDRRISPGSEWSREIDERINSAQIILLLISADFLASDYCHDVEMRRAMERHKAGEARVIPVILRPVDWKGADFSSLQALPKDGKAVTSWLNTDEALAEVAKGIRDAIAEPCGVPKPPGPSPRRISRSVAIVALLLCALGVILTLWLLPSLTNRLGTARNPGIEMWVGDWDYVCDTKLGSISGSLRINVEQFPAATGSYEDRTISGTIAGSIEGTQQDTMIGTWKNKYGQQGRFRFKLDTHGRSFQGNYSMSLASQPPQGANSWSGSRRH